METISLKEYGRRVGCNEDFKTLQEIQDYVEEHHDCTVWDYPLEEYDYVLKEVKDNCADELVLVDTEQFGIRVCELL